MMPDIEREARRKRLAPVIRSLLVAGVAVSALLRVYEPAWQVLPLVVTVVAETAVGVSIDPPAGGWRLSRRKRGRHGRAPLAGYGRDAPAPVGTAVPQWQTLVIASRFMPRSAGRRWLAEADSLLSEITATRRGAAIRSYLRSAPRLALMMWAHEILWRVRPGPRRPG